jgi:hypothetical protein
MCSFVDWAISVLTEKESKDGDDSQAGPFWFCGVNLTCEKRQVTVVSDRNMESVHMNYVLYSKDPRKRFVSGNCL